MNRGGAHSTLEIVTPLETAYNGPAEMVTLPAVDGQIGIYPMHVPLLTRIVPGEVIVRANGRDECLAVGEGLVRSPRTGWRS